MVAMKAAISRKKIASGINSVKRDSSGDVASKLGHLRRLRAELLTAEYNLVAEFIAPVIELLSDDFSPVRKFVTQLIGQLGLRHLELLPETIPALIEILKDDVPAVARQAIACGVDIFRCTLVRVALQGLFSSKFNESLTSSWTCVLKFRDEIYSMAFKVGSDGRRLPALKFVESVVLLYTPDPNGSSEPPSDQISEGILEEFNVSWLRGGHPILNVGDLSVEATRSLGLLLDQLRFPSLKSHSSLMIIVLIKSLAAVARKRPSFYGRVLPVLLALDPPRFAGKGTHLAGVKHALKNAFEACLECSHPGAAPWRDRILSALTEIKVGKPTEAARQMHKDNGGAEQRDDLHMAQIQEDEKSSIAFDAKHIVSGRKRNGALDMSDSMEDEGSGKRARSTPEAVEGTGHDISGKMKKSAFSEPIPFRPEEDRGPVQQLVAMFGALVAQGDKAAASLEILISSISADLLADVVLATMRNLPPDFPRPEWDEEPPLNMGDYPGMIGNVTHLRRLSLLLTEILSQSKSSPRKETGIEECRYAVSSQVEKIQEDGRQGIMGDIPYDGSDHASQPATVCMDDSVSAEDTPSMMESNYTASTSGVNDIEVVENEIPGLALPSQDDVLSETVPISPKVPTDFALPSQDDVLDESVPIFPNVITDLDDINQDSVTNLGRTPLEVTPSLSTERSEELSPRATDATSINSSTATSFGMVAQLPLPKISAPVIYLADEQKDQLQEMTFRRIIDAYKLVTVAGGSQVRFSILAHSGIEFPSDLDPWKFLKTHIFSDYVNHEGHELTLQVLNRLFGEAEEDRDFFSSTTATSVYETFLLQVAETLRDSFPATDKSLSRLLGEVPYLPKSLFEMLERLCSPGTSDNDDKELHGGDRVTQGLSTVWSLILLRPPIRDACLKIALKSAAHHLEEVRMKAIRLVANKLYPLSSISGKIEDFAKEMLLSVASDVQITLRKEADETYADSSKDENPSNENQLASVATNDITAGAHQLLSPSSDVAEVQRCMSLYFALCTKKHSLLRQLFDVYKGTPKMAKQVVHGQIPLLVRTIGSSRDLLDIISDPPTGSEGLVTQVVHTLTDGTVPSPELIHTIKRLYDTKLKDVDILIPILPFLPVDEVLLLFPHLVNTPLDKFQATLSRVLQGINRSTPVLTPAEALIAIHGIDPERDGIPLKKVTDACNACFEQREIFSQQVLAKVLNQLVEQTPLPFLFMRTVLQALGAFPSLVGFIMDILARLVSKQIWKNPKLWVGFMKCALLTKPQSFGVLLQLPTAQLEIALNRTPALKAPLIAHASQPQIRSTLPRSTLVALGIVADVQTCNKTLPTEAQTVVSDAQTSNQTLPTEALTVVSDAQTSNQTLPTETQTVVSDAQTSNQTLPSETQTVVSDAQTSNQTLLTQTQAEVVSDAQTSNQSPPTPTQSHSAETGISEKEASPDKSKESSSAS